MGTEIQRIYQTLAVEFQNAGANQVYITKCTLPDLVPSQEIRRASAD